MAEPDVDLLGRILPVDAVVLGTVSSCHRWFRDDDPAPKGATVRYRARLVEISTGRVLFTMVCSESERGGVAEKMVSRLAREAVNKIVD